MKNIELTDFEAKVLADHICERLQRLEKILESTTHATAVNEAETQREFYQALLQKLGFKYEDLKNWEILFNEHEVK